MGQGINRFQIIAFQTLRSAVKRHFSRLYTGKIAVLVGDRHFSVRYVLLVEWVLPEIIKRGPVNKLSLSPSKENY